MKKRKKIVLVLVSIFIVLYFTSSTQALTYVGETGINSGGLITYYQWFNDYSGVLAVTTTFANNSGMEYADVTVVAICTEADRIFRLRIYDSDMDEFVDVENEVGMGAKEKRCSVQPHMDRNNLTWIVQVTDEQAEIFFAQMTFYYVYDPDAEYKRVGEEEQDKVDVEEMKKEKWKLIGAAIGGEALTILIVAIIVIQKHGPGLKSFLKSKIKGVET